MQNITLQQIEIFVSVAEQLSLSGAARDLFIDQSAVSRWIQRLETSLNTQLFVRNSKGVTLTPDGEFLYKEFRPLLDQLNCSLKNIQSIYNVQDDVLRVGCYHSNSLITEFRNQMRPFEMSHPDTFVKVTLYEYKGLVESLLEKDLDCAVAYEIGFSFPTSLETKRFKRPASYLSIAADHPLIQNGSLDFRSLANETMILVMTPEFNLSEEWKIDICRQNGFCPKNIEYVNSPFAREIAIKNHRGFSIGGKDQNFHFPNEVRLFPFESTDKVQYMVIIWRKQSLSEPAEALIRSLQEVDDDM